MKKIVAAFFCFVSFLSCQDEVTFSNPGFQAMMNSKPWKGTYFKAQVNKNGALTLESGGSNQVVVLKTLSSKPGNYELGTVNQSNFIQLNSLQSNGFNYSTGITAGAVSALQLVESGTGYVDAQLVETLEGSGTGLKVNVTTTLGGEINEVKLNLPGNGYKPGDLVKIKGGDNNAFLEVLTVSKSGGVITVTENTGNTISGTFHFNAFNSSTGEVLSCKEGIFYKIPIQ